MKCRSMNTTETSHFAKSSPPGFMTGRAAGRRIRRRFGWCIEEAIRQILAQVLLFLGADADA
jgi:hypothetical protein